MAEVILRDDLREYQMYSEYSTVNQPAETE